MPKNSKGKEVAGVIPDKCIGCQLCVGECPVGAIDMDGPVARVDPEVCIGCGRCFRVCPVDAILFEKPVKKKVTGVGQKPRPLGDYKGVGVFIEVRQSEGSDVSWELIGKARELAEKLGTHVIGFLPGNDVQEMAKEAIAYGCDHVYVVDDPQLWTYGSKGYGSAMIQACEQVKPEILLLGATARGRDLASVIATRFETGLTADCTGLDVDQENRLLLMTRPAFGGNVMATILCRNHRPQMSSVRPGILKIPQRDTGRNGEIHNLTLQAQIEGFPRIIDFIPRVTDMQRADIVSAQVLVVVGKGACDVRHLPMLQELADLMGGTIACSRPVVQAGLLPYERQVGLTGKSVAPTIYFGIGVSGAVQHLVGMDKSDKIVAINIDRHAPLVRMADYAVIGDYTEVVPKLIDGIRSRIGNLERTKGRR